jgi:L-arabinose isomerase
MKRDNVRLRIGYLPFYVSYYEGICADFPVEKAAVANRCGERLAKYGELIWDRKLIGDVDGAAAAGRALAAEKPDCVVVITTIAVFGGICWEALKHIEAPVLIWNPQLIETVGKGYSMEDIVRNTGQIGTQALANTLLREKRPYRILTGYEGSSRTDDGLRRFFLVNEAVKALRTARLLAVGEIFSLMTDILIDDEELRRRVGTKVFHVTNDELTKRYKAVPAEKVSMRLAEMRRSFKVSELTEDEAVRSVRLCQAFHELVEEHDADAGTFNCHAKVCMRNPEIGITGCYSHGMQNSLGRPFTCTGDLPTALAMLLLKRLAGVAMYTEVQVMDERRNAIVIANSGEGEDGIRRTNCPALVRGNTNFTGTHGRGASFAYPLVDGPATVLSLTPTAGNYRLISAQGEILEESLPDAGALAGFFRFSNTDLHSGYTQWLEAGPVHHAATAPGHWNREIAEVASILGFEMVSI